MNEKYFKKQPQLYYPLLVIIVIYYYKFANQNLCHEFVKLN